MRKAWMIALNHFKLEFSNKARTLVWFGLPIIFTLIFGGLMTNEGGKIPIAVVDQDATFTSGQIVKSLESDDSISVIGTKGDQVSDLFVDKQIVLSITIPKGFQKRLDAGKPSDIPVVTAQSGNNDSLVNPILTSTITRIAGDYRLAVDYAAQEGKSFDEAWDEVQLQRSKTLVSVAKQEVADVNKPSKEKQVGDTSLGFIVMFVMFLVFSMGGVILKERELGTWARLLASPVRKIEIIGGLVLSFLISGLFQFTVLITLTSVLFKIHWGPILPIALLATALCLCASGMGLFLAGIVKTSDQQSSIGTIFITATSMLGGAFWNLDFVGSFMKKLAYLTPQAWALDGFRDILLRGASVADILLPIGVLTAFAAIFLTAGVLRVKFE